MAAMRILFLPLLFILPTLMVAQPTFDSLLLVDSHTVYFDFGKHRLRPRADSVLQLLAERFAQQPELKFHLTAHTDAIGQEGSNQALSERRAAAVRTDLLTRGVEEAAIVIETFGERVPVATNKDETGRQLNRRVTIDLYRPQQWRKLGGRITDQETNKGVEADIVIHGQEFRDSLRTDTSGSFRTAVPADAVIGIDVFAKGYFFQSKMLKAKAGALLDLALPPAQVGESADIPNLYFVGDQAVLLPRSEPELPKVLHFMQLNPDLKIEIAGHINQPNQPPVDRDSWSWRLSVARAKLVYDYLVENQIDSTRLEYNGYGNTQMRFPYARSAQQQAMNRRVEIRVLDPRKE